MNCFLTQGIPCLLHQSYQTNLFEIHVTVTLSHAHDLQTFLATCSQHRLKAIVINLEPTSSMQPMTCSRVTGNVSDAYEHAKNVQTYLEAAGFPVRRVKIEAAPWNSHVPQSDDKRCYYDPSAYFEYHLKFQLPALSWQESLLPLCKAFHAHLSHNALKHEADGTTQRFATIRSYTAGRNSFQEYTEHFQQTVQAAGFVTLTHVTEFCIYDSNSELDAFWYIGAPYIEEIIREVNDETRVSTSTGGMAAARS